MAISVFSCPKQICGVSVIGDLKIGTEEKFSAAASTVRQRPRSGALRIIDLRKSFITPKDERLEVLRSASLAVSPGETVAIMGASGCGKSTFLHLVGGLEQADHGSVCFDEIDITKLRGTALAVFRQRAIGFVFQFHYLLPDLTASENVALPLMIRRQRKAKALDHARRRLAELALEDKSEYPVRELSGGEQQRVALARALIGNPAVVIADEPTGNLDEVMGADVARILTNYARQQRAVTLVATHNPELARLCDRVCTLEGGRLFPS
ncbi:MAG: ABC transporter ATP-binding protein [Pyrinomonadaceae bacterium]